MAPSEMFRLLWSEILTKKPQKIIHTKLKMIPQEYATHTQQGRGVVQKNSSWDMGQFIQNNLYRQNHNLEQDKNK